MTLAHAGRAVAIAGMIASTAWKAEEIRMMRPGETVEVAGYTYRFDGVRSVEGPNYMADRGRLTVTRNGRPVAVLETERIGRASWRERGCQDGEISGVAVSLKKKKTQ